MSSGRNKWFFGGYSSGEIVILRMTFAKLRNHLEEIGIAAFTRLYDENQEAFNVFATNNVLPSNRESIANSLEARQHCIRVMNAIELCANKLNNEKAIVDYTIALAGRHCGFGIKADHFLSLFGCLRVSLFEELARVNEALKAHGTCCHRGSVASSSSNNKQLECSSGRRLVSESDAENLAKTMACPIIVVDGVMNSNNKQSRERDGSSNNSRFDSGCLTDDDESSLVRSENHNKIDAIELSDMQAELERIKQEGADADAANNNNNNQSNSSLEAGKNLDETAVWNKFFLTLSLALINSVELAMNSRSHAHVSKKSSGKKQGGASSSQRRLSSNH